MPRKGEYRLTPEQLDEKLDELYEYCIANKTPPVPFNIRKVVGVSEDALEKWRKMADGLDPGDESDEAQTKRAYREVLKKLDELRTAFWQNVAFDNPKLQAFAMFNLKQPYNGGYTDKPSNDATSVEITIKNGGVGSGAFE